MKSIIVQMEGNGSSGSLQQCKAVTQFGFKLFGYTYAYPQNPAWQEASLQCLGECLASNPVLGHFIDVEDATWGNLDGPNNNTSELDSILWLFDNAIGSTCGIYTRATFWNQYFEGVTKYAARPLWTSYYDGEEGLLANWSSYGGWASPAGKQFTDSFNVGGVTVDASIFG